LGEEVSVRVRMEQQVKRQAINTARVKVVLGGVVGDGGGFSSTFVGATRLARNMIATAHRRKGRHCSVELRINLATNCCL
jgi:hypothetical protein